MSFLLAPNGRYNSCLRKEFLGANVFDDRPFIVMPFLKNGNARDYVHTHPDCNRVLIVGVSIYTAIGGILTSRLVAPCQPRSCLLTP